MFVALPRSLRLDCILVVFAMVLTAWIADAQASTATELWGVNGSTGRLGSLAAGGGQQSPVVDPMGDAADIFGAGEPLLDIDTVDLHYDVDRLYFSMTFHTPIAPPSAGLPESVFGLLELDADQNAATGPGPVQNMFSPPLSFLQTGVDIIVDLASEVVHPGLVDILDTGGGGVLGTVGIKYGSNSLSGSVPLGLINDDGLVNFTTTIGTFNQPTDALEVVGISTPEPSTFALLCLALAGTRRRRR